MIELKKYTPEVYYKQSRDFQFIGILFDIMLNSAKTNADLIYDIPTNNLASTKLIDLLAFTLGFKATHNYNISQLAAICSVLPTILKAKGSLTAINIVCQTVLTAEGITSDFGIAIDYENFELVLYIPGELSDMNLLRDLLYYILPAGFIVSIVRTASETTELSTKMTSADEVYSYQLDEQTVSNIPTADILASNVTSIISNSSNDKDYPGMLSNTTTIHSPVLNPAGDETIKPDNGGSNND